MLRQIDAGAAAAEDAAPKGIRLWRDLMREGLVARECVADSGGQCAEALVPVCRRGSSRCGGRGGGAQRGLRRLHSGSSVSNDDEVDVSESEKDSYNMPLSSEI